MKSILISVALGLTLEACAEPAGQGLALKGREVAPGVLKVGQIAHPRITESSGLAASRKHTGVFWTHNDGGGLKRLAFYAIAADGKSLNEFPVVGAALHDWEDIAIDNHGHLFIADTGNNDSRRTQVAVYQVDEPDPHSAGSDAKVTRGWQLRFPSKPFDCESLFIHGTNGYVVSKVLKNAKAEIYRFPLTKQKEPFVLELVAQLKIDSPVTGADISADGRLLGLVAKSGAFVYRIDGDIAKAAQIKPQRTKFRHEHIEACCFVPEGLLTTAESREIYLFTNEAFHLPK